MCYLNSEAWANKQAGILHRANGQCGKCDAELAPGEAEVHYLTHERVGHVLAEDLVALGPGCHRRSHANG